MSDSRKPPSAAFWATVVVVVVLVGYPLSIGPACWLSSQPANRVYQAPQAMRIYGPLVRVATTKTSAGSAIIWWILLGMPRYHIVKIPHDDQTFIVSN